MKRVVIFALLITIALIGTGCDKLDEVADVENEINNTGEDDMESMREVAFREVDLSIPWGNELWMDHGVDARGEVDLSQFAGQVIDSIELAETIANEILEQRQADGFSRDFILVSIRHDPVQNIWIFTYEQYPLEPGMPFYVAVDGYTSELLRMWVY